MLILTWVWQLAFSPQAQPSQVVPCWSPRSQPPQAAGHSTSQAELLFPTLSRAGSENHHCVCISYEFIVQEHQQKSCSMPNECPFFLAAPFYGGHQRPFCPLICFQSAAVPYENRHAGSQDPARACSLAAGSPLQEPALAALPHAGPRLCTALLIGAHTWMPVPYVQYSWVLSRAGFFIGQSGRGSSDSHYAPQS